MSETSDPKTRTRLLARFIEAQRRDGPLLLWALAVGILAGGVGGAFRALVGKLAELRTAFDAGDLAVGAPEAWQGGLVSAVLAVAAVWIVRRYAPEAAGSGVHEIEGALDGLRPVRWQRVLPVKFGAGALAMGSGLLLGREGPTIQMGAALGRMLSDRFRLGSEHAHVLLAAGAGAGLTAAFNAPLAGMLFVIEEMRPQFHYSALSVQAVLVACAAADVTVRILLGGALVLPMEAFPAPPMSSLWVFPVFGALIGAIGYGFNRALVRMVDTAGRASEWQRLAFAGLLGGFVGWLAVEIPAATGGGEALVERALSGVIPTAFLLLLFLGRFALTVASYGTGAPGGIFAPMLALGTLFGLWFGEVSHGLFPALVDHPQVFTVAAMGALFSATVRAPITGIALAMELTGSYQQLLPILLTCVPATLVAHGMGGMPIYTLLLERVLRDSKLAVTGRLAIYLEIDSPRSAAGLALAERLAEKYRLELIPLDVDLDADLDVDLDATLMDRYGARLPVLEFEGIELAHGEFSQETLEQELKRAALVIEAGARPRD